jgi:hypothetical protein
MESLYVFFWVFPRRHIKFCRRFGTLCQVHIQRFDEEYSSETSAKLNLTPGKYPKENIQKKWKKRWERCIASRGDYFAYIAVK